MRIVTGDPYLVAYGQLRFSTEYTDNLENRAGENAIVSPLPSLTVSLLPGPVSRTV
jgi:hypothetical protein